MWRRPACQTQSKALDISTATAGVGPDLLHAQTILSATTVRRSPVDREDLKKGYISLHDQQSHYLLIFQRLY